MQGAGKAADSGVVYQDVHAARLALDQSGQRFNRGQTGDVALGDFSSPTCLTIAAAVLSRGVFLFTKRTRR